METKSPPQIDSPRAKEMKVLILGMPRTGTTGDSMTLKPLSLSKHTDTPRPALAEVLSYMGYSCYDWPARFLQRHCQAWDQALRAKYQNVGKPWGRREFDQLAGAYDVLNSFFFPSSQY